MAIQKKDENGEPEKLMALDGSPMPMRALPVNRKDFDALVAMTRPLSRIKPTLKGMIYGDVGSMKTTVGMRILNAVVPQDKKIVYFDSAEGWSTLLNYPEFDPDRILHQPVESHEQLVEMANIILMQKPPFHKIGGIMFDEYTQMVDSDLNWIVEVRAEHVNSQPGDQYKDPFTPALPDYNAARIRSNKVISKFLRVPNIHMLFIGHEKKDEKTARIIPDMQDKAGKSLYQRLHFVYHTENVTPKEKGKEAFWRMQTVAGNRITAKNRIHGIPSYVLDDSVKVVIDSYTNWGVAGRKTIEEEIKNGPEKVMTEDDLESILEGDKK